MPSSRPQVFGLSRDVTLAVLPRLYMQEVLIELGRRDIDFRQVLISTLHDVMVREYQQLDIQSEPTTTDVTRHVTRRVGYSYYDPSLWAGELVGRRGPPVERFRETYLRETHMDAPTDLSMRPADSGEVKEPERRDTKESFHIVTEPRIDQGQWSHTHAYTEYNTTQETSHDDMTQVAENGKIFERPSSEKEDRSPVESREEYGRGPSTSSVSQDEEYRGREQEESNAALTSNTSGASPDTEPHDQHSQSSITTTSSTSTGPQETSTSQYQKKLEMDAPNSANRPLPLGARRINYWKGYSRRKITHDLPTLPVSQPYMPSSLSPLHISTASAEKVPTGKRKTDKEDACMPPTTAASDEATSSKRSKRHESGDVTVRHANGPAEPPASSEKDVSPYQTPPENEIVPYRDLSVDAPSEEQIRPYWTQPKSPALHIEWVSSISKGSVESWKKDVEGKEESEKNPSDKKPSNSPETAEDSAATANDLSKPASSVMQNKADTHRQTLQLASGAIPATQQSRSSKKRKKRKIITADPRQQENIRDPTEQAKPTIAEEEGVPTARKTDSDDAKTSQSSLPTSLQEPGVSPQGREGMPHTRDFSLPVKLRQFALPGMWQRNDMDTSQYHVATSTTSKMPRETVDPYQRDGENAQNHLTLSKQAVTWSPMLDTRLHVLGWTRVHSDQLCSRNTEESTSTTSKMPREMVDSYQRDGESARKHFTLSKEVVSSLPMPETRLHGLAETRVYGDQPCQRNAEKDDENHVERTTTVSGMTSDTANCTPKEPETAHTNSHSSVLSSALHEAPMYKRQEEHSGRSSMNLHSSAMQPEPIAYSERQLQANDTPAVPQPSVSSYHGQDGRSATEAHMEHRPSEPATSYERERRLNHETTLVNESSLVFPYRRTSDESPGTQSHSGSPSSVIREALPSYQKLVQVNGSTVWVPRSFAAISPPSFRPLHVNPGITGHAHESYALPSSQIENIETRPQREPIPMESQEAMPNHHQVDNDGAYSHENQPSEEQNAYNDQPATFLTQKDINFAIKQEPLSPLSDTVKEEERELIQGVLSGASLAESLEQQMLESGDAPRETDGLDLQETGADEGSSSEKSDGSRKLTKLYYCPLCSYFTRHRGNIKQHVRVHTRERPFKCPLCEYTGARKEHVQVHMKRHTGERPFKCDHCDYRTSRKPDLVKHLRTHSGDRPYACPKCAYRAAVQSALVNHLRTHTGEKPYKCPFCDYCIARKRDLSKHMERHGEDERCQAVKQYYYHLSSIDSTVDDK